MVNRCLVQRVMKAHIHRVMLNIVSVLIGLFALLLLVPSLLPFLGWGNWFVLPVAAVGAGLGAMSRGTAGRNLCLVVLVLAILRLILGGGIL